MQEIHEKNHSIIRISNALVFIHPCNMSQKMHSSLPRTFLVKMHPKGGELASALEIFFEATKFLSMVCIGVI